MEQKPGMYRCWREAAIVAGRIMLAYIGVMVAVSAIIGICLVVEKVFQ